MTPRQRVLTALNHERPDRAPRFYRDVPEVRERLLRDLELADSEALFRRFGVDFRWVTPVHTGPLLDGPGPDRRRDIWGVEYKYVRFDEADGYWEPVTRPMQDWTDPSQLDDWPWPSPDDFDFSSLADDCDRHAEFAIMTGPGFASPGLLQCPIQSLVGEEQSLILPLLDPDFFTALVRKTLEFQLPFIDRMLEAAGGRVAFFRIGDDFGTQNGLVMSPQMWREHIAPGLRAMADVAKQHGAHYYQHSCGAVRQLIPDLIDIGVEVLDPLQVTATGMVPAELKAEFGGRLCFSGGVDEMHLLREGTPTQVRAAVFALLDDMTDEGGFFLGPTHNFQADVPTANIVAMYDAADEWEARQ